MGTNSNLLFGETCCCNLVRGILFAVTVEVIFDAGNRNRCGVLAAVLFEKYQLYFMICDFAQGTINFAQSFATIF